MYILKIQGRYVIDGDVYFGIPPTGSDIKNARTFDYDQYVSFLQTICLPAKVIEIEPYGKAPM